MTNHWNTVSAALNEAIGERNGNLCRSLFFFFFLHSGAKRTTENLDAGSGSRDKGRRVDRKLRAATPTYPCDKAGRPAVWFWTATRTSRLRCFGRRNCTWEIRRRWTRPPPSFSLRTENKHENVGAVSKNNKLRRYSSIGREKSFRRFPGHAISYYYYYYYYYYTTVRRPNVLINGRRHFGITYNALHTASRSGFIFSPRPRQNK